MTDTIPQRRAVLPDAGFFKEQKYFPDRLRADKNDDYEIYQKNFRKDTS